MDSQLRDLGRAFVVTFIVLLVQLAGWHYSNSLALLGDSAHVFSDILAIGASLFAMWLASRGATTRRTFGMHRVEVFAAFFNGILLVAMSFFIAYEALTRLGGAYQVSGLPMLLTSFIGLAGNIYVAYHLQHDENLNIRSAFIHAAGDALSSVGVIAGALIIMFSGMYFADIAVSFLISILILFSAYSILRSSLSILLESAPYGAEVEKITAEVMKARGVKGVHDVHVWRTCSDMTFAMLHVETEKERLIDTRAMSADIEDRLSHAFNITHTTIQYEPVGCSCENRGMCDMLSHKKHRH